MRFQKGAVKRLKEEVVPTLRFLEREFPGEPILVRFPADYSPADATIRRSVTSAAIHLQLTCDFNHNDERRLRILHRDGYVHGSGPIYKVNGRLETQGRAYSLPEVIEDYSRAVIDRLNLKMSRCTHRDMWLLVHINDERLPPEGVPELLARARAAATQSPFAATFLVGSTDEKRLSERLSGAGKLP
jgi:hypothetical protein